MTEPGAGDDVNEQDRCSARSTYGGTEAVPVRCALKQGHARLHNPRVHGYGPFSDERPYCRACDFGKHICPGCGDDIPHGKNACDPCMERV